MEKITEMISEKEVDARILEIANEISSDFKGEAVHLVCILKGSVMFTAELAKRISVPVTMDFMKVSSYHSSTESSGIVKIIKDLDESIAGKNVIVVEDIIDTGRTFKSLMDLLGKRSAKSLKICSLLEKPSRREVSGIHIDYLGFTIPDEFVVGYGLDFDQRYRNLPFIGKISFESEE